MTETEEKQLAYILENHMGYSKIEQTERIGNFIKRLEKNKLLFCWKKEGLHCNKCNNQCNICFRFERNSNKS